MVASKHFSEIAGLFDEAAQQTEELLSSGRQLMALETAYAATPNDPFDYVPLCLSAGEQLILQTCRNRIVAILSTAVIDAGRELLRAKASILSRCPRGTWSRWLKTSLCVSESTARNYMAAAEWSAKTPTVGEMPPGAIYRGAVAPPEVQADIVQKLTNGESVQADQIAQMIAAHREAKGVRPVVEKKDGRRGPFRKGSCRRKRRHANACERRRRARSRGAAAQGLGRSYDSRSDRAFEPDLPGGAAAGFGNKPLLAFAGPVDARRRW